MHTQCSENKQTVPVKVKFYCIYIISNGVCTCVPSLGLLAPAFQQKQAKTHKKAKMGFLDSRDLEHCTTGCPCMELTGCSPNTYKVLMNRHMADLPGVGLTQLMCAITCHLKDNEGRGWGGGHMRGRGYATLMPKF